MTSPLFVLLSFFFFNDTATTEIYTLSLHDALPIFLRPTARGASMVRAASERRGVLHPRAPRHSARLQRDRKSTRLNSSHTVISYAVFCLKKKKKSRPAARCVDTARHRLSSRIIDIN